MSDDSMDWLTQTKFWILLLLTIPSIVCSISIFIYYCKKWQNISINNHLTLILIIISFLQMTINFPFIMDYYQRGTVFYKTNTFCLWWNWWEYGFNGSLLFIMAWGSIERHLLIFYRTLMNNKQKIIIFHYLPMTIFGLYPLIFYFVVMALNTCQNQWNYDIVR